MNINCNKRYLIALSGSEPDVVQHCDAIDFLKKFNHINWGSINNIIDSLEVGGKFWVNDTTILVRLKNLEQ